MEQRFIDIEEDIQKLQVSKATGRLESSGMLNRTWQLTFPQGSKIGNNFQGQVEFLYNNCGREFVDMRSIYLYLKFSIEAGANPGGDLLLSFNPVADCFNTASAYINGTMVSRCDFVGQTSAISQRIYFAESGRNTAGTVQGLQAEEVVPAGATTSYEFAIPLGSFLGVYNCEKYLPPGLAHRLQLVVNSQYKSVIAHNAAGLWSAVGGVFGSGGLAAGQYRVNVDDLFIDVCRLESKDQVNFADMALAPYEYTEVNINQQGVSQQATPNLQLTLSPSAHLIVIGIQNAQAGTSTQYPVWHFDAGAYVAGTAPIFTGGNMMNALQKLRLTFKGIEVTQQYTNTTQFARMFYEFLYNVYGFEKEGLESKDTYQRLGTLAGFDYSFASSNKDTQANLQLAFDPLAVTQNYNVLAYYKARRLLNIDYDQIGQVRAVNVQDV